MLFETIIWPTPVDAVGPDDQAPAEAGPDREADPEDVPERALHLVLL